MLAILIFLTVIVLTLIGAWTAVVGIYRAIAVPKQQTAKATISCPWCEQLTTTEHGLCQWCEKSLFNAKARNLADIAAIQKRLRKWQTQGNLDPEKAKELLLQLESEKRVLEGKTPLAMTSAKPAAPKPAAEAPIEAVVVEPAKKEPPAKKPAEKPPVTPVAEPVKPTPAPTQPQSPQVAAARSAPKLAPKPAPALVPKPKRPTPPVRPVVEKPPRRTWRELVQTFLEEREIPAVELFGVLLTSPLIITGAVILVIYFWETLQEYPVLKFSAFAATTIGSMLVGLLACIRWQLKTTGRGLLGISLLLVPLSFLAVASSGDQWPVILTELAVVAAFAWLITWAGRVVVPDRPWHLAAAILAPVVAIIALSIKPELVSLFWSVGLFGVATVAAFATPLVLHRRVIARLDDIKTPTLIGAFFLLGTSIFPLAFALGLAAKISAEKITMSWAIDALSVSLSLAAAAILAFSLTLTQQLEGREKLASWRAAATAVGLTSVLGLVAGLLLAWPWSSLIFTVALIDTAVLVWIAIVCRFPWTHAGAIVTGAATCLTGYHLFAGHLPWRMPVEPATLIHTIFGGTSAAVLVAFSGLLAATAAWFTTQRRKQDAQIYAWGTAATAIVSLVGSAAAAWFQGGTSIPLAVFVFTIYGLACLIGNRGIRIPAVTHTGLALLVAATLWGLYWLIPTPTPIWAAVLGIEALALALVGYGLGQLQNGKSEQPNNTSTTLIEAYRLPALDVADALAGLTLFVSALILLPDLARFTHTAWPAFALTTAAGAWFLGAWTRDSRERTWIGSATILLMLVHTLVYCLPDSLYQPWLDAVLLHATLGIAATLACQLGFRTTAPAFRDRLHRIFLEPISQSAGLSSAFALPLLFVNSWEHMLTLSLCLFWLSAIWLVVAAVNRLPALITGAQAVMCLASVAAATKWLQECSWNIEGHVDLTDLRTWQVYGLALALLTLLWTITRVALQRLKIANDLLEPEWPSLDRLLAGGLCILQLLVAAAAMLPAIGYELGSTPANPATTLQAAVASPASWLLLLALATCCTVGAWNRWREPQLLATLAVFGTLPWLIAASLGLNIDAACALRWAAAATLAIGTAVVCLRQPLAAWANSAGIRTEIPESGPQITRATLLGLTLLPILGITLYSAAAQLTGTSPAGPATGTFFHSIGTEASYLVPLVITVAALVVLAWRESSSVYAFSAGMVTKLSVILACLLSFTSWGADQWAIFWYSLTITSAVWAAAWITARRKINVWRETGPSAATSLMRLELGIGALTTALVLAPGLFGLLEETDRGLATLIAAAGSWLGWLAIGSLLAAAIYRCFDLKRPVPVDLAGLAGLTFIGLVACTVSTLAEPLGLAAYGDRWGFHTMMIGWATYAVLIALSTWWIAEHVRVAGADGPPQILLRSANTWVIIAGALAVLLGLVSASFFRADEERLWGATAIGLASAASATMAVWRRRELWAFISGLGVNVAASFTVSYFEPGLDRWSGFLLLFQANVIAGAVVALAWLAVSKRLYALSNRNAWSSPLLSLQIALTSIGAMVLVVPTAVTLITSPGDLPYQTLALIGSAPGTMAVLLTALAAGWYTFQLRRQNVVDVIALTALAGGALLGAGSVSWTEWFTQDAWLPYHATIIAWTAFGLILLAIAMAVSKLASNDNEQHKSPISIVRQILPAEPARLWHFALTLSAAMAALVWCVSDPARPYVAAGVMLAGVAGATATALWRRQIADMIVSGILINLAGNVAWIAWRDPNLAGLIETNALCLTIGAILWTILQFITPRRVADITLEQRHLPYADAALYLALALLDGLAIVLVMLTLAGIEHPGATQLTWWTVLTVAGALLLRLITNSRQLTLPGLYYLGLIAVGLTLDMRAESARHLLWLAGPELAACALVAAAVYVALRATGIVSRDPAETSTHYGVLHAQWAIVAIAAALATATALDTAFAGFVRPELAWLAPGRWTGPLAIAALLPTAFLMAQSTRSTQAANWRYASLITGALLLATIGWAWLPTTDANLLNQTVVLMVAAVAMVLVSGVALPRLLNQEDSWVESARKALAGFAGTAAIALTLILIQEVFLFNYETGAPMATWAVIVVTVAMAAMIVGLIALAVSPRRDPLDMTEEGRTLYVYAAEVLGGLIALHLWLTEPQLFRLGIVEQYWMLIVIAIAFIGAGLSEWFHRLGLPVLSKPLANTAALLPLAPAIGYWIPFDIEPASVLAGSSPAVWFCASLFYAVLASTQRSRFYSFLALGTLAAAFCLLWQRMELGLTEHIQLYGIPIGISILLAEQIHHRELKSSVASTMRYVALTCIYLTSSAEFLWELGDSIWLPLTLIALSILGILAGIFLRIRSFVIVGFTSLALVLGALVYHAAVDQRQAWVFAVALLALGIPTLGFFMVFEKKKAQILAAANRFWNWERRDLISTTHDE